MRIDHHSREINDILSKIVEMDLAAVADYFDSRLQKTAELKRVNRGILKEEHEMLSDS